MFANELQVYCIKIRKAKVHPRRDYKGPEGEKMYSSTLSLTLALDGVGWLAPHPGRYISGKEPVPIF